MAPCDSCGHDSDVLVTVRRVYVTPESWDTPERVEIVPGEEHWCFACRTHYPHEVVGAAGD